MKVPHMAIPIVFSFQPFPMGLVWIFSVCSLEFILSWQLQGQQPLRGLVSAFRLPSCHQRNWEGSEVGLLTEGRNSFIHQKRLKIWEDDSFPASLLPLFSHLPLLSPPLSQVLSFSPFLLTGGFSLYPGYLCPASSLRSLNGAVRTACLRRERTKHNPSVISYIWVLEAGQKY